MKNKICLLLLVVFLLVSQLFFVSNSLARGKRFVGVKYGLERYNCTGFGICLIFEQQFGEMEEFSRINLEGDLFLLEVPFAKAAENREAFSGTEFLMNEPYIVPMELTRELGAERELVLTKGKHPMLRTEKGFLISFKVQN